MHLKNLCTIFGIIILFSNSFAGNFDLSCDFYSRYVWRGTDFGNSPSIQPNLSYSLGPITFGAWSAWATNGDVTGNENDLFLSVNYKSLNFTVTDYFFPIYSSTDTSYTGDEFFNYEANGVHTLEASLLYSYNNFSLLTAVNFYGDDAKYVELSYSLESELSPTILVGLGDGAYSTDEKLAPVHLGLNLSKGKFSTTYILNPNLETSYLVFGYSL